MMNHTPPMSPGEPPQGLDGRVAQLEARVEGIESRLAGLEVKLDGVVETLKRLEAKIDLLQKESMEVRRELARLEGRVSNLPTILHLMVAPFGTFAAGTGILIAAMRLTRP
jgi:uncharacterized coiled-coil protein SlyX